MKTAVAKKSPPRKGRDVKLTPEQVAKYSKPSKAIALREQMAPEGMYSGQPTSETATIINAITKASKDPKVDISKLDWLLKTRDRLLEAEGEQAFNEAMTNCQAELEPVRRDASNPQTHSRYASYPALDAAVRPTYSKYRFALSFDTEATPDPMSILVVCYVTLGRHKRRYSIPMPCDGKGPKGNDVMTRTHATGSAVTYGKRYLLGMIFNIVVADKDDDGNRAGGYRAPPNYHDGNAIDPKETGELASKQQLDALRAILKRAKIEVGTVLEIFSIHTLEDMTQHQCAQAIKKANKNLERMFAEEKAAKQAADKAAAADPDIFPGDRP